MLELNIVDESKNIWHIKFSGAQDTLYAGEQFTLHFRFDDKYPFEAPEVKFIGTPPLHEHIYANGFICLSTLDKDWTPALTTANVVLSILSMLSSATVKQEPPDNARSTAWMNKLSGPEAVTWEYHDLKC